MLLALNIFAKELEVSELNSLLNSSAVFSFWGSSAPSPAALANALFPASSLFPSLNLFISSGEFFIFSSMLFSNCLMSILILGISALPTAYFSRVGRCFSKETSYPKKDNFSIKALTPEAFNCCNSNIFSLVMTKSSFLFSSSLSSLLFISSSLSVDFFLFVIESSLKSFSISSSRKL